MAGKRIISDQKGKNLKYNYSITNQINTVFVNFLLSENRKSFVIFSGFRNHVLPDFNPMILIFEN